MSYKDSLYKLYLPELALEKAKNALHYGFVKVGLYFHIDKEQYVRTFFQSSKKDINYISKWGYDSNIVNEIKQKLSNPSTLSRDTYDKLHTLLTPIYHKANEGKNISLTNQQARLSKSDAGLQTKVRGIAGCGKSTIIAYKAVNIVKRKGENSRVLILSYNITLKNYLRDKISAIREDFSWDNFNIIHFHGFISQSSSIDNINIKDSKGKINYNQLTLSSFKDRISDRNKYDAILIDEGQDFNKEWFDILKYSFLKKDGEFLIMADEKQNIYDKALDNAKKTITNITGPWNNLNATYRLDGKLKNIAKELQYKFFKGKYELDIFTEEQMSLTLNKQDIIYKYNGKISYLEIFNEVKVYAEKNSIHFNNVCILANEIIHLRELEYSIRNVYNINCEIMFETKEEFDGLRAAVVNNFESELENIRRIKKFGFNNNSGKLKLCTTHSFKGWESETLVLIIDKRDTHLTPELLYTAITRCKKNFIVYNIGNTHYNNFFVSVM
jgi:superfamily I DNA/RNA helicase